MLMMMAGSVNGESSTTIRFPRQPAVNIIFAKLEGEHERSHETNLKLKGWEWD
jgi:hypothetical protein